MKLTFWMTTMLAALLMGQTPQEAEKRLQAAIHKETVEGDLRGAVAAYRKVIAGAGPNRAVAAQAQLRLGLCYEKLGAADATKVYRELLSRYGDQKEVVAQAQARLSALSSGTGAAQQGVSLRLLWDNAIDVSGRISADGRWMSFVDWPSGGNVGLRDLRTGVNKTVNKVGDWPVSNTDVTWTALSNDGKQIAYLFRNNKTAGRGRTYEIRVVGADGSNDRTVYKGQSGEYMEPVAWLMDNRRIAVTRYKDDAPLESGLLFVDAADGKVSMRVKTAYAWPAFSPDGKWFAYSSTPESTKQSIFIGAVEGSEPPQEFPARPAGESVGGWSPDGRYLLVSSGRDGSIGHWLRPVADGRITGEAILVKGGVPDRAFPWLGFTASGGFAYAVRDRRVKTMTANVDLDRMTLSGALTPFEEVRGASYGASWSPDGKRMFYRVQDRFVIRDVSSGAEYEVLPRGKRIGQRAQWAPSGNEIVLFQEDGSETGFVLMDARTGELRPLVKARADRNNAYAIFSPDGRRLYFNGGPGIGVKDMTTGEVRILHAQAARALALSPDGSRLALKASQRKILILDSATGKEVSVVSTPRQDNDFGQIAWTQDGAALLVELWRGGWSANAALARVLLDGNAWKTMDLGTSTNGFAVSPDGKQIAVTQSREHYQVWLMENFLPKAP
jgi:Tol biopolymer transport system component